MSFSLPPISDRLVCCSICLFVRLCFEEWYKTFAHFSPCVFVLITRVFFGKLTISPYPLAFASLFPTCHLFWQFFNSYRKNRRFAKIVESVVFSSCKSATELLIIVYFSRLNPSPRFVITWIWLVVEVALFHFSCLFKKHLWTETIPDTLHTLSNEYVNGSYLPIAFSWPGIASTMVTDVGWNIFKTGICKCLCF